MFIIVYVSFCSVISLTYISVNSVQNDSQYGISPGQLSNSYLPILYVMQISRLQIQCHWSIRKWYFSLILRSSNFVSIPHPVAPPPSSNGWYSVLATGVIAIPPSGPETVHSVQVFNLVLQINKQTDDSTLLQSWTFRPG